MAKSGSSSAPKCFKATHSYASVKSSLGDEWIPFYESLWSQAVDSLQRSDSIVVIDYSMPEANRRSRALLLWNANKRPEVLVCCASSNKTLRTEFEDHGFWHVREVGTFADLIGAVGPAC
jgi:hypothetical protein